MEGIHLSVKILSGEEGRRTKFKSFEVREASSSHLKKYALMVNKIFQFSCLFVFKLFIV